MKYFATVADVGIVVRAAESLAQFTHPDEWKEVPAIEDHANERGVQALDAGKRMVFTQHDQSWPQLYSLFA